MTLKGHAKVLVPKPMRKQADMTSNWHAKALVLKPTRKPADMNSKGLAKALVLKPIEERSRQDLERACEGARPQAD